MLMIRSMTARFDYAKADVSDGENVYQVEYNPYEEFFYLVTDDSGCRIESYARLEDCIYSRFSGIFLALQRGMNACNMIYGTNILSEITSSKEISVQENCITAVNRFTHHRRQYVAQVKRDCTADISASLYTVIGPGRQQEEYTALYQAVKSEFYPVLADLDHDLDRYVESRNR